MSPLQAVATYGRMIKFAHSVFALPFALSGAMLAAAQTGISLAQIGWIALAMVGARSAAMGFNRLVDRGFDAANPRTAGRELPQGMVSVGVVWVCVAVSALALLVAAWRLNPLCLYLSPVVLGVLFFYSLTKRFTWASHLVLGLCLGGAPLGAWIGVTGTMAWPPVLLGLAVLAWVAGFDIIYACQDYDFDRSAGLHSIPARFGPGPALHLARLLHLLAVLGMAGLGYYVRLGLVYWIGVGAIGALLVGEHYLVRSEDLSRVNVAFFNLNAIISLLYFACTLADLLVRGEGPWWRPL